MLAIWGGYLEVANSFAFFSREFDGQIGLWKLHYAAICDDKASAIAAYAIIIAVIIGIYCASHHIFQVSHIVVCFDLTNGLQLKLA